MTNEARAIQRYIQVMEHLGRRVVVFTCGLVVPPSCPWLGATPDRVVYDPHKEPTFGLVEVKCPWSKTCDSLREALASEEFCVQLCGHIPELKVSAEYYAQVMGQMCCSGLKWTHFVVYAEKWIVVCKVVFSESTWIAMKSKLDSFYFNHVVPYIASLQKSSQGTPITEA